MRDETAFREAVIRPVLRMLCRGFVRSVRKGSIYEARQFNAVADRILKRCGRAA